MASDKYCFYGQKLKALRKKRKLAIDDLGRVIGKSSRTVGSWERNERKPSLSDIRVLSDFFAVPTNELSDINLMFSGNKVDIKESIMSTEEKIHNLFETKLNIEQKSFLYELLGVYKGLQRNVNEKNLENHRLTVILNSVPVGIYAKDKYQRYFYSNSFFDFIAKTDDIIGRTDEQVLPKQLRSEIREIEDKVIQTGKTVYSSVISYTEDGYTRYLSISVFPVIKDEKLDSVTGSILDISKRMNAIKQYKLLENIIESLDTIIWVRYKKPVRHVVFLNSAIERIVGISQKEFNANPRLWTDIVHPEDQFKVKKWSDKWFINPGSDKLKDTILYRIIDKNGNTRNVKDSRSVFEDESKTKIEFGLITDITEIMQLN